MPTRLCTAALLCLVVAFRGLSAEGQDAPVRREGKAKVGAGEIHYLTYGTGEPLVLLHGYSNAGVVWERFLPEFAKQFRVVILDLPGHGHSTNTRETFTHRTAAEDLLQALDTIGVTTFSAVGHSSGGMILLHLAAQRPGRLKNMVLVATAPRIPAAARDRVAALSLETAPPPMLAAMRRWHVRGDPQIRWLLDQQRAMANDHTDMNFDRSDLGRIGVRTLIVHGDRDEALPLSVASEMREALPNSSLLVLPDARHGFLMGESLVSRIFKDVVLEFLSPDRRK